MKNLTIKASILFQLDMCWQLYLYHVDELGEDEALWVFAPAGLQVRRQGDGWCADWPKSEGYEMGPPSIAWVLWHIIYWWSTALDANFGDGTLQKGDIPWPGSVTQAKETIQELRSAWAAKLEELPEEEYSLGQHAQWPFAGRSFANIALWRSAELMKNAAEIGSGRFLYAAHSGRA